MSAVDGASNTKTNGFQLSVANGTSATLTYDLNGNMTSDGTNSYVWDAENRLLSVIYPGSGNHSDFSYEPMDRNVKILEYSGGSLTSTKQFVWSANQRAEARNAAGAVSSQFFPYGESISGVNYYWNQDHLASCREMTDSTGNVQAQYSYDPFGKPAKLQGSLASDFQYAGYYLHDASKLNVSLTRLYNCAYGRFFNRDPIEEEGGLNLYAYVANKPIAAIDPSGLAIWIEGPSGEEPFGHKSVCVGNPLGKYDCVSFCINLSFPNGRVYYDPNTGGPILQYKVTTPQQDAAFIAKLPKLGTLDFYGPCNTCRDFSQRLYDSAPGIQTKPPVRRAKPHFGPVGCCTYPAK